MSRRILLGGIAAGLVMIAGGLLWQREAPHPPALVVREASADTILANRADGISFFRLAGNPRIVILDFADPAPQARMFDRLAALVERAGLPRDRILTAAETAQALAAETAGPEGFYWGHDYAAASVARFMTLAARDGVALTAEEAVLRQLAEQEGWLTAAPVAGVISVARAGPAVTEEMRACILAHELSHGAFFAHPGYAAHAHRFWTESLTEAERTAFAAWLGGMGYDTGEADLLVNEAQAYLFFTPDLAFFDPAAIGMTQERRGILRAAFLAALDPAWLRGANQP